jgi:cupin fold WbuC family metalloprotein
MKTRLIDPALLDELTARAQASQRRRMNENLHPDDAFPAHRLLNAIEPDSYVRPHRHLDPIKDETILCLRGRLGCILFDEAGGVQSTCVLEPGSTCGIDIAHGQYHSLVALLPGSVMFEAKAGPYQALTADELAPWAPAAGSQADAYLVWMFALFDKEVAR